MKNYMLLILVVGLLVGCAKDPGMTIHVDPAMTDGSVEKIAVFPFASWDDPNGEAQQMIDGLFRQELDTRNDYKFITSSRGGGGLDEEARQFVNNWRNHRRVDQEYLNRLNHVLHSDAILIGVVDLWHRDRGATQVGATITILRLSDGTMLFEAIAERTISGSNSETIHYTVVDANGIPHDRTSSSGGYSAPPDYIKVAGAVVEALVASIPVRTQMGERP